MDHGHLSIAQAWSNIVLAMPLSDPKSCSDIVPVDEAIRAVAYQRLDVLTKPLGALGRLEALAAQLCAIQRTLDIRIAEPLGVVFAADHGAAERGVSAYPREVTAQMVANFLHGGAAISVLAKLQGIELWIVDAGVAADCSAHPRLIDAKIRRGTRNFIDEPAMTPEECTDALQRGRAVIQRLMPAGSNTLVLGEMGIGNTASAALLMHGLTTRELIDCVGRGTGLDDAGLERKRQLLEQALKRRRAPQDPLEWLTEYGGYEIAMLTGAVMAGAARQALIVVDGFTVTVAVALAAALDPAVLDYCVFGHCSAEHAHRALLEHLRVEPLLDLEMRLGEGSGAAVALSVVRAAASLFTEMATFEGAGVSNRED
jgi:nicotinate-nucleotide--dimethylbenzimidazole phosphoribosyltransferase